MVCAWSVSFLNKRKRSFHPDGGFPSRFNHLTGVTRKHELAGKTQAQPSRLPWTLQNGVDPEKKERILARIREIMEASESEE